MPQRRPIALKRKPRDHAKLLETRKDLALQRNALRVHVAERRIDEKVDSLLRYRHLYDHLLHPINLKPGLCEKSWNCNNCVPVIIFNLIR